MALAAEKGCFLQINVLFVLFPRLMQAHALKTRPSEGILQETAGNLQESFRGQESRTPVHIHKTIQCAANPPEFAQPRLSRVKAQSSPARGDKFRCVCSYMAGHDDGILMTGHIGTNTPKFVPPRRGRPRFVSGLQTCLNLHPPPRVGPPLGCLPGGGANLCRFVPVRSL